MGLAELRDAGPRARLEGRQLECGDSLDVGDESLWVGGRRSQHHRRRDNLAVLLIWRAEGHRLHHRRVREHRAVDLHGAETGPSAHCGAAPARRPVIDRVVGAHLEGRNLLAAPVDELLEAAGEGEEAVLVEEPLVARVEPAPRERLPRTQSICQCDLQQFWRRKQRPRPGVRAPRSVAATSAATRGGLKGPRGTEINMPPSKAGTEISAPFDCAVCQAG